MNRQTLAVTLGAIVLLALGALLLYATPAPAPTPVSAAPRGKAKATSSKRLPPAQLIHKRPVAADRPAAPPDAPNVVVVFVSSQRRDQWTVYGGADAVTPRLAEVARTGVVMQDALSASPDPHTAAAALTTGRHPHHVGAVEVTDRRNGRPLPGDVRTLAERMSSAGWFTIGATGNHHYNHRMGQAQGFDWYRDSQPYSFMLEMRVGAIQVVQNAVRRANQRTEEERARPLFMQLALADSHKPFRVPPSEFRKFEGPDHNVAPYRATVRRIDNAISRLIDTLSQQDITAQNTVFVVVADHGEGLEMPVHHRKQHGYTLYGSSISVPWVMWGKGVPAAKVGGIASTLDVAPTVLGLIGLPSDGMDGHDLSGLLQGGDWPRTEVYSDTLYEGVHRASLWTASHQCQREYGTTVDGETQFPEGCFDRAADPTFAEVIEQPALWDRLDARHTELMQAVTR